MAGHSQFSNIKHRKSAQDHKKSKKFTKVRRELLVAARSGIPDVELNGKLKAAIYTARKIGFPKERIEETIKSASNKSCSENYEEMVYEAYGPYGVAIIMKSLTDNRNRTASDLRYKLSRYSGSLADPGSVSFLFDELGCVTYSKNKISCSYEELFETAMEADASDIKDVLQEYRFLCFAKDLGNLRDNLLDKWGEPLNVSLFWKPKTLVSLDDEQKQFTEKLLSDLYDMDDIQYFNANTDIDET